MKRSISLVLASLAALSIVLALAGCGQDADAVSKEIPKDTTKQKGKRQLDYLSLE